MGSREQEENNAPEAADEDEDGEGQGEQQEEEGDGEADAAADATKAAAAAGSKRKQPEEDDHQQQQQGGKRQQQRGGHGSNNNNSLARALNRDSWGSLGFSVRAWRGVMMEWLGLLAASKAAKRLQTKYVCVDVVATMCLCVLACVLLHHPLVLLLTPSSINE